MKHQGHLRSGVQLHYYWLLRYLIDKTFACCAVVAVYCTEYWAIRSHTVSSSPSDGWIVRPLALAFLQTGHSNIPMKSLRPVWAKSAAVLRAWCKRSVEKSSSASSTSKTEGCGPLDLTHTWATCRHASRSCDATGLYQVRISGWLAW